MKCPTTPAPRVPTPADPSKQQWLRQWACKIVSELPSSGDDKLTVLRLAEQLTREWIDQGATPKSAKRGRAAR